MKGKGCFIFLIIVAAGIAGAAKFILPSFIAQKQYDAGYVQAAALMNEGKIVEGAGKLTQGIIAAGGFKALSADEKNRILGLVKDSAVRAPEKSIHLIEFLMANGIDMECETRNQIYRDVMKHEYVTYYKTGRGGSDGALIELFTVAAWAGTCMVDEDNLKSYKQLFDGYKTANGDDFVKADWMAAAYAGKPVSIYGGPINIKPVKAPAKAAPAPAPAKAAEAPKEQPAPAPAAAKAEEKPAPAAAPAKTDEKPAAAPAKAEEKPKEAQPEKKPTLSLEESLKKSAAEISAGLKAKGVKTGEAMFDSKGKNFSIIYTPSVIGGKETFNGMVKILEAVSAAAKRDSRIQLQRISVKITDKDGGFATMLTVLLSDYLRYKNGEITADQFANLMM